MNVPDFLDILQKSNTILSPKQTREIEDVVDEYPYFQSGRALYLKGLKNLNSHKYNNALKVTAAHTADREVLFDFITSPSFNQNKIADTLSGKTADLKDTEIISEEVTPNPEAEVILGKSKENPLPQNLQDAEQILNPELFKNKEQQENDGDSLNLGSPINFTQKERHSFTEWLQLTSKNPVERDEDTAERQRKFDLLDKFIETNPKIVPNEDLQSKVNIKESIKIDKNELMTETLAKVYLEQKKYKKAIQAFKILSLKYPEKSGFFADQIRAVKKLQKDKD